jgi:hypothetical protein
VGCGHILGTVSFSLPSPPHLIHEAKCLCPHCAKFQVAGYSWLPRLRPLLCESHLRFDRNFPSC